MLTVAALGFALLSAKRAAPDPRLFVARGSEPGAAVQQRLKVNLRPTDFEATGLYLSAKSVIDVDVQTSKPDALPELVIGTYSHDAPEAREPRTVKLKRGHNRIEDADGGLLYVRLAGVGAVARLKFGDAAEVRPVFRLGETTDASWPATLAAAKSGDVLLQSRRAAIVVDLADAAKYADRKPSELLGTIDRILDVEDDAAGLAPKERVTVRTLMAGYPKRDLYMFATWYRTAYSPPGVKFVLDAKSLVEDGWGPWHEQGHMHQQADWTWGGVVEVTVNIFSRAVERSFGQRSRLERDGVWPKVRAYLALPDDARDYDAPKNDLFVKYAMLEQLRFAYGDDLWRELMRRTRARKAKPGDDGEKRDYFALETSRIAKRDLRGFYAKWGLALSASGKGAIAALKLPPPAVDPTTLESEPATR